MVFISTMQILHTCDQICQPPAKTRGLWALAGTPVPAHPPAPSYDQRETVSRAASVADAKRAGGQAAPAAAVAQGQIGQAVTKVGAGAQSDAIAGPMADPQQRLVGIADKVAVAIDKDDPALLPATAAGDAGIPVDAGTQDDPGGPGYGFVAGIMQRQGQAIGGNGSGLTSAKGTKDRYGQAQKNTHDRQGDEKFQQGYTANILENGLSVAHIHLRLTT